MNFSSFLKPSRLLVAAIALYIAAFSYISLWKYDQLRYNARDLAIYNQVVWQTTNSKLKTQNSKLWSESNDSQISEIVQSFTNKFYSSIQGHNYLGDHGEPVLLLLAPFYKLFPDPRTLLILQTIALALAAFPLYLITSNLAQRHPELACPVMNDSSTTGDPESRNKNKKKRFIFSFLDSRFHGNDIIKNWLPMVVGILWLLHPAVQNANLFEFHSLTFAPLFLFSLFYFYLRLQSQLTTNNYILFTITLLLSLSVREDVALIIFMLGLFMLWQGIKQRRLIPITALTLATSAGWFIAAQRIIAYFSPSQGYQFRIYYTWLTQFNSFSGALREMMMHIFTLQNLEMLIGLLLPLLFLPLLRPKWLLLALPPLAAIILSQSGGSALIWQTHYSLLLLPAVFLAFATIFIKTKNQNNNKTMPFDQSMLAIGALTAAVGSMLAFGPLPYAVRTIFVPQENISTIRELMRSVPPHASIASTDRFLAPLSSRSEVTLLPLALLGVQQYGAAPYAAVPYPDYILLDERDVEADLVQARTLAWTSPYAQGMAARLRDMWARGGYELQGRVQTASLFIRTGEQKSIPPFAFEERAYEGVRGGLELDRLGSVHLVTD